MLDKNAPFVGQRGVNLAHASEVAFECATKVLLAREIPAVADPNRMGCRAQRFADLNAFEVVFDGLPAHSFVGMRKATEFVRESSRLILKGVRVHRVEVQSALRGKLSQLSGV